MLTRFFLPKQDFEPSPRAESRAVDKLGVKVLNQLQIQAI
jgi:hypothetical protein